MTDLSSDAAGWSEWVSSRSLISAKMRGARREVAEPYFLAIHAATEAMLRQILFVGFRLNRVTYGEASEWLYHNDETPENKKYPELFDRLYRIQDTTWLATIASVDGLDQVWSLWLEVSKVVRNHISHGIRKYNEDWLDCTIRIDQELLIRLDLALSKSVGGSVVNALTKLSPRLPKGTKNYDFGTLTGRRKSRPPRPRISLTDALSSIAGLPEIKLREETL
jgi:hypothetical protein